jgi:hypothetical protein
VGQRPEERQIAFAALRKIWVILDRDTPNRRANSALAKNNKTRAAKLLGLPRGQFYSLLRRHGLTEARR